MGLGRALQGFFRDEQGAFAPHENISPLEYIQVYTCKGSYMPVWALQLMDIHVYVHVH